MIDNTKYVRDLFALAHTSEVVTLFGEYHIYGPIKLAGLKKNLSIRGEGNKATRLIFHDCNGPAFAFEQEGIEQPYGLEISNITFKAVGQCQTGLTVSYGQPEQTSDHFRSSVILQNITIESDNVGAWQDGIAIQGAWNATLDNVFISGNPCGGNWNDLFGVGIRLIGMCVNAHLTNVRCNFWATGLLAHSYGGGKPSTEGIFCSNCSMVGVQRGVWIMQVGPRSSTLTWTGGMIECRVSKVEGGKAAFHLQNIWTALINCCQMLTDSLEVIGDSYGVIPQDCRGVIVSGCDINAFTKGVMTTGDCQSVNIFGNTFTNTPIQVLFTLGTVRARSFGNSTVNVDRIEVDLTPINETTNKIGFVD